MESDDMKKAAYILSQTLAAFIETTAMIAANTERDDQGYALAYGEEAFMELIKKYGLDHNSVIKYLYDK